MVDCEELFVPFLEHENGGRVLLMLNLDSSKSDYTDLLKVAKCFAARGHVVHVLSPVHYKDPLYRQVFGDLIGTRYYRKCPDLLVDGEFVEYESFNTDDNRNAFRNMLHNGLSQTDRVVLRHCNLTDGYMRRVIFGRIKDGFPIEEVWIFDGAVIRLIYKTEG